MKLSALLITLSSIADSPKKQPPNSNRVAS